MIKKKYFKKFCAFSLAAVIVMSCVTGCGNSKDNDKDKDNSEPTPTITQEITDNNNDENSNNEDPDNNNEDNGNNNDTTETKALFEDYSLVDDFSDYQGKIKDADGNRILTKNNELIYYNNSSDKSEKLLDVNKDVVSFGDYWNFFKNADGSVTVYFESGDEKYYEGIIPANFQFSDIVNVDMEEFMPFIYTMSADGTVVLYDFDTNDEDSTMEFENYDEEHIMPHKETVWAFHNDPNYSASHKSVSKTMTFTPFDNRSIAKDDSGKLYFISGEHDGDFEYKEIALTDMPDKVFYSLYGWVTIYGLESTPDRIYVDETKDSKITLHQEIKLPDGYTINDIVSAGTEKLYKNMMVSFKDGTYAIAGSLDTNSDSYSELVISDFLTSLNKSDKTAKLIVNCDGQDSYLLDKNGYYYDIGSEVRAEYSK